MNENIKRTAVILIIMISFTDVVMGQLQLTPFAGVNSTSIYQESGGNYPIVGIELEGRLKPRKISKLHLSMVTGASYLSNGYYVNSLFSVDVGIYKSYTAKTTDLSTQYLQVPVALKLNYRPFPLVEDFTIFFGFGVTMNFLQHATLSEKTVQVSYYTLVNPPVIPPPANTYQDSRDITDLGRKQSLFTRWEVGMKFRRIHLAWRLSASLDDMYFTGLENIWNVPAKSSGYISPHASGSSTTINYSELVVGYRIF